MPTNWSEMNGLSDGGTPFWFWTTRRPGGSLVRSSHRVPQHSHLPGRDVSGREHSEYSIYNSSSISIWEYSYMVMNELKNYLVTRKQINNHLNEWKSLGKLESY